jgi:hypothetical protein
MPPALTASYKSVPSAGFHSVGMYCAGGITNAKAEMTSEISQVAGTARSVAEGVSDGVGAGDSCLLAHEVSERLKTIARIIFFIFNNLPG